MTSVEQLQSLDFTNLTEQEALSQIRETLGGLNYRFADVDETKPWGAYYRMDDAQTERFLQEFFPGLSISEAKLGNDDNKLSPKILVAAPGQRLSWQYHHRRAERWRFLTEGGYHRSDNDDQGELRLAKVDDIVQFNTGERHRLCATESGYTIVAEIWQHTDPEHPSDEPDIIRVSDDYHREI